MSQYYQINLLMSYQKDVGLIRMATDMGKLIIRWLILCQFAVMRLCIKYEMLITHSEIRGVPKI